MFENMEYIYEVYKEKSFSKAAQKLYISQPALSATIKKVEDEMGITIFDRSTYPIGLTECGKEYIKCIEKIMDVRNGFYNYLNDRNELKTGSIAIGSNHIYASYILPPIIAAFSQRYPLIEVKLSEGTTESLNQQFHSGTLDLVIDNYQFEENISTKHYAFKEHFILMGHSKFAKQDVVQEYQLTYEDIIQGKHLLKETKSIPLELFQEEPFVLLKAGNDSRNRANKMCQNSGFTPKIAIELDQLATAYNIANYGMGITFVSDTVVKKVYPNPEIVFFKLDSPYAFREVYFFHRKSKYMTKAMEEFIKIAANMDVVGMR